MARIRLLIAQFPVSRLAFKGPQDFSSKLANDSDMTQIDCTLFPTCRRHVVYCTHLGVSVCPYESVTPNAGSWRSLTQAMKLGYFHRTVHLVAYLGLGRRDSNILTAQF